MKTMSGSPVRCAGHSISSLHTKRPILFVGTNDRAARRERINFNEGLRFLARIEERINIPAN
jgi:hypothetical protein